MKEISEIIKRKNARQKTQHTKSDDSVDKKNVSTAAFYREYRAMRTGIVGPTHCAA